MSLAPTLSQKQITSQVLRKMRRELPVEMIELILSFVDYSVKFLEPTSLLYAMEPIYDYHYHFLSFNLSLEHYNTLKNTTANKETKERLLREFVENGIHHHFYNFWSNYGEDCEENYVFINNDVPLWFKDVRVGQTFNSQVYQVFYEFHQFSYVVAKKNKKSFKIDQFICEWKKENGYVMTKKIINTHTIKKIDPKCYRTDLGFFLEGGKMPIFYHEYKCVKDSLAGFLNREIWRSDGDEEKRLYEESKIKQAIYNNPHIVQHMYDMTEIVGRFGKSPVVLTKVKTTYKLGDDELKAEPTAFMLNRDLYEIEMEARLQFDDEQEEEIFNSIGKGKW